MDEIVKLAEQVTFSGRGMVDRCAYLRNDDKWLAGRADEVDHKVLPVWRGKILVGAAGDDISIMGLSGSQGKVWQDYSNDLAYIGKLDGINWSAVDISSWEPDELPETLGQFSDPSRQIHPALGTDVAFAELRSIMANLPVGESEIAATAKAILGWHERHRFCANCGSRTAFTTAGWQRDCSVCEFSHFPRTDPVVIMLITKGDNLLLGRSPGWPEKMYSLLAGFVEPGETIEAAVRREVKEESNIDVGEVRYLASQPWPFPSSLMIGCQGAAMSETISLDKDELDDAIWISRNDLAAVFAGTSDRIAPARRGSIAHFLMKHWLADLLG